MRSLISTACVLIGLAGACSHASSTGSTQPTSASFVSNERAIQDITKARCDREQACNNFGDGRKYDSYDACAREVEHDTRATIRAEVCPYGISDNDLASCLKDVRDERCGNPVDTVARFAACSRSNLCR